MVVTPVRYWPLESGRIITSPFGPRAGGFHAGVDFGYPGGSGGKPAYAIQSGIVLYSGAAQGYGMWVVIDSADAEGGGVTEFGHIVPDPWVRPGARVEAGQRIGHINPDTRTNGGVAPHLHLSDMPRGYDPAAKQDPLLRLAGAREPGQETAMPATPWTGDPIWLEDVLREALGDRLVVDPGWKTRGTGRGENGTNQMGPIFGVMIHHTGNANERPEVIRDGVWQTPTYFLPGPLSQCLIKPDGTCHLVAIGPCNHAGTGSYPGIPKDTGNTRLIGFECSWPTIRPDGTFDRAERWPDAQIITMRDATAAVLNRLGKPAANVIGHKDYSDQGKWDPGNLDIPWFRGEVAKAMRGEFETGTTPVVPPPPTTGGFLMALSDKQQQEMFDAAIEARDTSRWLKDQLGPGFDVWGEDGDLGRNKAGQRLTLRAGLAAMIRLLNRIAVKVGA